MRVRRKLLVQRELAFVASADPEYVINARREWKDRDRANGEAMKLIEVWRERQPRSATARFVIYAATVAAAIVLGVLAVRGLTAKPADDCNKPAAPVVVPKAPVGLIVDAPCTDGSTPKTAPAPGK
jgi:hypothetical protein